MDEKTADTPTDDGDAVSPELIGASIELIKKHYENGTIDWLEDMVSRADEF